MGNYAVFSSLLLTIVLYLIFTESKQQVQAAPGAATNADNSHRIRNRPFLRPRPLNQYARIKQDLGDFIVDDDDFFELNKRQASDDYGHLRFGKRDEFDDYGHMRFGRSGPDNARD